MSGGCEYPNCRKVATQRIVIERGDTSIKRGVCDEHAERAQEIAERAGGIAYRLHPD